MLSPVVLKSCSEKAIDLGFAFEFEFSLAVLQAGFKYE